MLQIGCSHGDDRFYNAVKARRSRQSFNRNHNNRHYQQSQRSGGTAVASVSPAPHLPAMPPAVSVDCREQENRAGEAAPELPPAARSYNLDRFLESTAPLVRAQCVPKEKMKDSRTCDGIRPYFFLADLWESFSEWSAYGAGVPLVLNGGDCVVQYYVPYLSGIQLYGVSNSASSNVRSSCEESDGNSSRDSNSEGSTDYEHEKDLKYSRAMGSNHGSTASGLRINRMSRDKLPHQEEESSNDDFDLTSSRGHLLFEFLEHDPPFVREPMADKISDLTQHFPALRTLRSCDLSASSWMSVAWYPIYRIPVGPTPFIVSNRFNFSFKGRMTTVDCSHPLSLKKGIIHSITKCPNGACVSSPLGMDSVPKIRLQSFGLASYKFRSSVWTPNGGLELQTASTLLQDADNWLQVLNVNHPDYRFFSTHGAYRR